MNIVDIVILGIIGLSVVYGIYRGFLRTVLSVASVLAAVFLAITFGPVLADALQSNQGLVNNMVTFTDAVTRVGDAGTAQTEAGALSDEEVDIVVAGVKLPGVLRDLLRKNLKDASLRGARTVNEYVSTTLVTAAIRVLCCIAVFIVSSLVLHLVLGLIAGVAKLPLLKTMDGLAGALFGLARGAVIVYVLFLLLPIAETILPEGLTQSYLEGSRLAGIFASDGLFVRVIQGKVF